MICGAIRRGKRRYQLWRLWDKQKPLLLYILLNPSHANEKTNDRTVLKLIGFSKRNGYGGFYLGNIQTFISPKPAALKENSIVREKINLEHLKAMKNKCEKVVLGWGNASEKPTWINEISAVNYCFGTNKNGSPKHPLYLRFDTKIMPYNM
ncbi:MAG: DUF1643 domain-containing protein [Flavobacteriaceae bacterium]|nr:DUF1643 domain-containing protein [Flavobacteriaceae bacterium]